MDKYGEVHAFLPRLARKERNSSSYKGIAESEGRRLIHSSCPLNMRTYKKQLVSLASLKDWKRGQTAGAAPSKDTGLI